MARILVVDDEPTIPVMLKKVLERAGHEVMTAVEPQAAFDALAGHDVDVLLVDKNMPDVHGGEVIATARQLKPGIGVVLMTANPDLSLIRELKLDAYLPKPFRALDDVTDAVGRALAARERRLLMTRLKDASSDLRRAQ